MYVEPNTNIRLLNNVPLDNTYEHTIYFASGQAQRNYFIGKTKHSLTRQSYQRKERGYITVGVGYESLIDCNYVMFQNSAFGSKWFYAFITSLEYNNVNSTVIHYEIDVMQTWLFEATLEPCFVEREHSATDNYFEHILPENLDTGDDYVCKSTMTIDYSNMAVCILASEVPALVGSSGLPNFDFYPASPHFQNNVYSPVGIYVIPVAEFSSSNSLYVQAFKAYVTEGKTDAIIAIYQIPSELVERNPDWSSTSATPGENTSILAKYRIKRTPQQRSFTITPNKTNIDGYVPKNKKLFNAPYNVLQCSNKSGDMITYKWENFELTSGGSAQFETCATGGTVPEVMLRPIDYLGYNDNVDMGILASNFPVCAWVSDAYRAWWAQNKGSIAATLTMSLLSAGLGIGQGLSLASAGATAFEQQAGIMSATRSGASGLSSIMGIIGQAIDKSNVPNAVHGQAQIKSLNAGMSWIGFDLNSVTIKREYAKVIDDFFERYGYACKLNKIPNRNVRPHWCYCKTVGCTITGGVPSDDMSKICSIYDNGITWWKNGSEVGNYSLNNTV